MRTQYRHGFWIAVLLLGGCAGLPSQNGPVTAAPAPQAVVVQPPIAPTPSPVVPTSAPPSTPPTPSAAAKPVVAPLATAHTHRGIVTSARHPADHHTARPSRPARSESAVPDAAATASLRGHVTLDAGGGQHIAAGDFADTLVYFVPKSGDVVDGHRHERSAAPEFATHRHMWRAHRPRVPASARFDSVPTLIDWE